MPNYSAWLEYSYDGLSLNYERKVVKADSSKEAGEIAMAYLRRRGYKPPLSVEVWEDEFAQMLKPELTAERD
jgi:hypothetical protein